VEENDKKQEELKWGAGHINADFGQNRIFSNTLAKQFGTDEEINNYFEKHPGLILTHLVPNGHVGFLAFISKELTDEEVEELNEFNHEWAKKKEERLILKAKAKAESEAARIKAEQELREQVELGVRCKNHHGKVIEENHKLKEENAKLRKLVPKEKRK